MSSCSDEEEDQFFESLDRIASTSGSDTEEDGDCLNAARKSQKSNPVRNACTLPLPMAAAAAAALSSKYEVWKGEPGSVRERRQRLLRELGLSNDRELQRESPTNFRQQAISEIQPDNQCSTSGSHAFAKQRGFYGDANLRTKQGPPGDMYRSISCDELSRRTLAESAWSIARSRSDGANPAQVWPKEGAKPPLGGGVRASSMIATAMAAKDLLQSGNPKQLKAEIDLCHGKNNHSSSGGDQISSLGSRVDRDDESYSDSVQVFLRSSDVGLADLAVQHNKEAEQGRTDGIGIISHTDSSGGSFCKIKNLDNGKEFVVNELGEDGMWNKLRDMETGRQLTMEEFEMAVGHSPIVQELMRRESVERAEEKEDPDSNGRPSFKSKKKGGWLKTIKVVAHTIRGTKDKKSSDERDTSSEKGGRRSSSATDDSQDILLHMPQQTKVRQYGKSCKELTALYMRQEIQAHQGSIWTMEFSLDGHYLASAGQDRIIYVWQVMMESERKFDASADKADDSVSNTYVTVNGSPELLSTHIESLVDKKKRGRVTSGRKSSTMDSALLPESIFLLSEKPVCSFEGHVDDVLDLSWSQTQFLLSSSMDKTVRLWQMSSKSCLRVFSHNDYVTCIQFNPVDDKYFISGSLDKKVRIWSIPDRQIVDWTDLHEMVTAACYTPDGQGAFVGTNKGNCYLYNTPGNKLQEETQIDVQKKKKKSRGKKITGFQFAPGNSRKVLITSADSRIRVFDGADLVQKYKGFRNTNSQIAASFTANGKYVISASEDSYVYIWNYDSPNTPAARNQGVCRAYEYFSSRSVSVAIPWPGMKPEPLVSHQGEFSSCQRYNPELLLQGTVNTGRKSGSFPQVAICQDSEASIHNASYVSMSGNSEARLSSADRNANISEGIRVRDRVEGSVPETKKPHVFLTCNGKSSVFGNVRAGASIISDSMSGSLQANLTASSASHRVLDHSSPNHGFLAETLSKGSATWPEEKLSPLSNQCPSNLAVAESPNSLYETGDGTTIRDQSSTAAWGLVIVTAGLGGEIRTFQNYGWPVRL